MTSWRLGSVWAVRRGLAVAAFLLVVAPVALPAQERPTTRPAAAESVTNMTECKRTILSALRSGPMTDEELIGFIDCMPVKYTAAGIRGRRCELVRAGLVEADETEGTTVTGRRCRKWRIKR